MNTGNKIKAGVIFGLFMAAIFMLQKVSTVDHNSAHAIVTFIFSALFIGTSWGLIFAWFIGLFTDNKFRPRVNEDILFCTLASFCNEWHTVRGRLYFTSERLVFHPFKPGDKEEHLSVTMSDIKKVARYHPSAMAY